MKGSQQGVKALTTEQIDKIMTLYEVNRVSQVNLATRFGVTAKTISRVINERKRGLR